ncbi:MAG: sialate O-acetylesterase [Rubripirellula sp.]
MRRSLMIMAGLLLPWCDYGALTATEPPVQVYILAGQSNMQGKAKVSLLEHQIRDPRTKTRFEHLHEDGKWIERDDVQIKFLDRHGKLTVGYGSPKCIGPELDFGFVVGDASESPVLIIKTAWGGKSLYRDFRPPSSSKPDASVIDALLEKAQKKKPDTSRRDIEQTFGVYYRLMMEDVQSTLSDIDQYVPEYGDQGYEIAGFAWFQGWNDMVNAEYTAAYSENMANLIRDVRKDLGEPKMPFVIAVLGVGGVEDQATGKVAFKAAQSSVGDLPEFDGNLAVIQTDQFWDKTAEEVFKKGWKKHLDEWQTVGSDYPFHYLGSPSTYGDIGRAMAGALLELNQQQERDSEDDSSPAAVDASN